MLSGVRLRAAEGCQIVTTTSVVTNTTLCNERDMNILIDHKELWRYRKFMRDEVEDNWQRRGRECAYFTLFMSDISKCP